MKMNLADNGKDYIQQIGKRIVGGWVMSILGCFIALRLGSYLGVFGFLGLMMLMVPAFALYQGWKPWLRYIFFGE
ncbi:hypothetical protein IQ266_08165 [filamentous cyanobacterium LEGE 11480]|uniref:Uncharacterized protein n=1 Tax=Romeriopsis navalis LEGE 11480 TaxID=2777977 RepID=A0A928Z3W5_9CYAN|nr:hypothetical protein [Romeriopsis navalis]MBE9029703.1 hypothetical protein [Romeriopsis navalis LEGE 11480]